MSVMAPRKAVAAQDLKDAADAEVPSTDVAEPDVPKEKGIGYYIGLGIGGALLLVVIALAVILIVVPKVAGATPLTVLTTSMEPRYPPGTLIYVLPVKPAQIRIGDVITYQIQSGNPAVISHRVISINSDSNGKRTFILKGDNNAVPDLAPVIPAQIKGRLWYAVPLLGWVNSALNGSKRSWIVDVLAGLLFAYAAYMVAAGVYAAAKERKRKRLTTD
jgi:signal peptidase I